MKRSAPLRRTSGLRPRSKRTAALYRTTRAPLVAALLKARPVCERCQAAASTDVHELRSRARGGSITDVDNLAALCRPCHDWITTHPSEALAQGWLRSSWE